jgi:hypothetical protein
MAAISLALKGYRRRRGRNINNIVASANGGIGEEMKMAYSAANINEMSALYLLAYSLMAGEYGSK